jgi:hypothetical protein
MHISAILIKTSVPGLTVAIAIDTVYVTAVTGTGHRRERCREPRLLKSGIGIAGSIRPLSFTPNASSDVSRR